MSTDSAYQTLQCKRSVTCEDLNVVSEWQVFKFLDTLPATVTGMDRLPAWFWATVCKTVRPMLSDRCLSCLTVTLGGVLWPNGWMDQDETWSGGSLGAAGYIELDGDPAAPPQKGHSR